MPLRSEGERLDRISDVAISWPKKGEKDRRRERCNANVPLEREGGGNVQKDYHSIFSGRILLARRRERLSSGLPHPKKKGKVRRGQDLSSGRGKV